MKTKQFNKVKPYCYILIRLSGSIIGSKYFGFRYKNVFEKRSPREDFGKYYFSSSTTHEKKFKKNPKNYKFVLHSTFDTIKEARFYERNYVNKYCINSPLWSNKGAWPHIPATKEIRKKISRANKGKRIGKENPFYGKKHTKKIIKFLIKFGKTRKVPEERKKRYSIIFKGKNNPNYGRKHSIKARKKMSIVAKNRVMSEETKRKISLAVSGEKNGMFGKKHSQSVKNYISKINKGRKGGIPWNKGLKLKQINERRANV